MRRLSGGAVSNVSKSASRGSTLTCIPAPALPYLTTLCCM